MQIQPRIFLAQRFDRERLEYLCDLENCPYSILEDTCGLSASENRFFIAGRADSPRDFTALSSLIGGVKNLILQTKARVATLPSESDVSNFFSAGGIAIFEDGWHDYAFRRMLREINTTKKEQNQKLEIQHHSRIILHKLGSQIFGITHRIGYNTCQVQLFGISGNQTAAHDFSLHIAPGVIAHGKCKIVNSTQQGASSLADLEFTEFDSISRILINDLVNSEFTLQKKEYGKQTPSDKETFQHLEQALAPFAKCAHVDLRFLPSPFDPGSFISTNPFLVQILTRFALRAFAKFPLDNTPKILNCQLRENIDKKLCVFLSIPAPCQVEISTNNSLVMECRSPMSALVSHADYELLRALNVSIEQYPAESHEHIAICLEETFL